MGRSRRKLNKFRKKVSVRPKKKPRTKSSVPVEVLQGKPDVELKLGSKYLWDSQDNLKDNYLANGLLANPNAGFGRNKKARLPKDEEELSQEEPGESDDDLRQVEGKHRRDGKKGVISKPTAQQQRVITRLLEAHGNDLEAMVKDRKLNQMLLPASKLRKLIQAHNTFGSSGRCGFRTPIKHL